LHSSLDHPIFALLLRRLQEHQPEFEQLALRVRTKHVGRLSPLGLVSFPDINQLVLVVRQ
jgi:hypothetical protein